MLIVIFEFIYIYIYISHFIFNFFNSYMNCFEPNLSNQLNHNKKNII